MKKIYKHGKLLLTAEYAVLDGARALALPTLKGQKFTINPIDQLDIIIWQAFDYMNDLWFWAEICTTNWTVIKTSEARHANRIIQLLKAAKDLNPEFYPQRSGFKVTTELDFPISWGLGSSSTLIAAVADWSENDPHLLSKRSFGGSGYDVAAASMNGPFVYQLTDDIPKIEATTLNWSFKDQLYLVHRNQKQNSRESIKYYRSLSINERWLGQINELTKGFIEARNARDFGDVIRAHESAIALALNLKPVQQELFPDFKGHIKSLGGWGGDFMLALGSESSPDYFKAKGYPTVVPFKQMVR